METIRPATAADLVSRIDSAVAEPVFASLTATTPTVFADLSTQVYNFWDRGLLGLALHPGFPATPYVYVLNVYNRRTAEPIYHGIVDEYLPYGIGLPILPVLGFELTGWP